MIFFVLICTLIGYLCGSALIGLGVGLAIFLVIAWADTPSLPRARKRRRFKR